MILKFVWEKPVITFYKERFGEPEKEAFVAIKARRLSVSKKESKLICNLKDFFPIIGKLDYLFSEEGKADNYVLCWFDDAEDFGEGFRRMTGVSFSEGIQCITNEKGKMTCNANYVAKRGKLE